MTTGRTMYPAAIRMSYFPDSYDAQFPLCSGRWLAIIFRPSWRERRLNSPMLVGCATLIIGLRMGYVRIHTLTGTFYETEAE